MKMFNYLFYKLHQATLRTSDSNIPEFMASIYLGSLINSNLVVLCFWMSKLKMLPLNVVLYYQYMACIPFLLSFLYFRNKRFVRIFKQYSKENEKQRVRGNYLVLSYVIISFLLLLTFLIPKVYK